MSLIQRLLFTGLLLFPLTISAKESTTWDFRNKMVPGDWSVMQTLTTEATEKGLHIKSSGDAGRIYRQAALAHNADTAVLTFADTLPQELRFSWRPSFAAADQFVEYPFVLTGFKETETVVIPLRIFKEWEGNADIIGLTFPGNADVTLQDIQFHRYSLLEKFLAVVRSSLEFDNMRNYSINFLWGPLMVFTPDEIPGIFLGMPPRAWSVLRFAFPLLGLVSLLCFIWWLKSYLQYKDYRKTGSKMLRVFAGVFVVLWLLFDLRMGLELLSYVKDDFQNYVLEPTGQKTFREFLSFHDVVAQSKHILMRQPRYVFLGPSDTLFSYLRYETYPSLPALTTEQTANTSILLVFKRPDVQVNERGTVIQNGQVIASSGSVLARFDDESFLYQLR